MDHQDLKEMQLFSCTTPHAAPLSPRWPPDSPPMVSEFPPIDRFDAPSLDLQLSISVTSLKPPSSDCVLIRKVRKYNKETKMDAACIEALKWQATEQIRLAAIEKAYAERVRELTRREMELAQSEFARARHMWERAREEAERAEKLKERATETIGMTCMEVTCQSCRQKFRA